MKTNKQILTNSLIFFGLIFIFPYSLSGQVNQDSLNNIKQDSLNMAFEEWRHMNRYNRIIQQSIFTSGTSDDEMAGMELWRAGRNLKRAVFLQIPGYILVSSAATLPKLLTDDEDKQEIIIIIFTVSGGIFIVNSLCQLISGYNKIGKAGIIIQHKKFNVKTNGTSLLFNF